MQLQVNVKSKAKEGDRNNEVEVNKGCKSASWKAMLTLMLPFEFQLGRSLPCCCLFHCWTIKGTTHSLCLSMLVSYYCNWSSPVHHLLNPISIGSVLGPPLNMLRLSLSLCYSQPLFSPSSYPIFFIISEMTILPLFISPPFEYCSHPYK